MLINYLLLSHILCDNTPSYGNRDKFIIRSNNSISSGSSANTSTWIFSNNHIGTHIDSPYHFSNDGKKTFQYDLSNYIFQNIEIVDVPCLNAYLIEPEDLINFKIKKKTEILLIRTGFEKYREQEKYWNDYPGISSKVAIYIRKNFPNIRCIGFDFISLTSTKFKEEGRLAHIEFLNPKQDEKSILIIEDMSLINITKKISKLTVAPIFVIDGNGGPVTIIAET